MLPNFLGIGAQRCGTSWLDAQLRRHPQIYLPTSRKELHFFDDSFDRGIDWYQKFFRRANAGHRAIGEITPKYIFVPESRDRIRSVLGPKTRFIVLLRNPVERAFSQYTAFSISAGREAISFQDFLDENPDAISRGFYARQLSHFAGAFEPKSILVLIHEEIHESLESERRAMVTVSQHLDVDPDSFSHASRVESVGQSLGAPRFRGALNTMERFKEWLRKRDLDWLIQTGKRMGIKKLFFQRHASLPRLTVDERQSLYDVYEDDIVQLEERLERDLSLWRNRNNMTGP